MPIPILKRILLQTQTALETVRHEIEADNGEDDADNEQDLGSMEPDSAFDWDRVRVLVVPTVTRAVMCNTVHSFELAVVL